MVEEQPPPGESWLSGLMETIKQKPALYGGIGALVLAALVVIVVLAMSGGGDGETTADDVTATSTTSGAETAPSVTVPDGASSVDPAGTDSGDNSATAAPVDRNPLNGEMLDTASTDRVVAVKVDNSTEAGPPIGIQDAELIVEVPVEGGITRLTALFFENEPQVIGPVRSVRPVDADLLAPWKPLLVSTGGRDWVIREHVAAGIEMIEEETESLFQQIERRAPYHLVATIPLVELEAGEGAPPIDVLPFGDGALEGEAATTVAIPFSGIADVEWVYEPGDNKYRRVVNGADYQIYPQYDADPTGFSTDTIIVMKAAQRSAGYTDTAGADVPTFDVIGFGEVMVFNSGQVRQGQWLRSAQADGWVFLDESGSQFTIPPGDVWLEIVPRFVEVTTE